jgi:ribonucleotide monophosphatase NagD (HAD superfamily)
VRVVAEVGRVAGEILYIGDRVDNDIRPAQEVGVATALLRRGPWGHILDEPTITERRSQQRLGDETVGPSATG